MNFKELVAISTFATMTVMTIFSNAHFAFANAGADVVINEVAWAGSNDNAGDEWLELYNNSNAAVNLAGWSIVDDGTSTYNIEAGVIPAKGYFLIEDNEDAVSSRDADAIIPLSFANSGDSLQLLNAAGAEIDVVNSAGGAWFAGDGGNKATMERVDPMADGDNAENWGMSIGNNDFASNGSEIVGTPGRVNSIFAGVMSLFSMNTVMDIEPGAIITVNVQLENAFDVFAYGLDIEYDTTQLRYLQAIPWGALSHDEVETNFQAELENGVEGKLVMGHTRLDENFGGIDVNGVVARIDFEVIGENGAAGLIGFSNASFLSDINGEIEVNYDDFQYVIGELPNTIGSVNGLEANPAEKGIELSWQAVANSEAYIVEKLNPLGNFVLIAETNTLQFVDLNVLPGVDYRYRVAAKNIDALGDFSEIIASDNRSMIGDLDMSDRVDGKDLELLARAYGYEYGEDGYVIAVDINYDGIIDGLDLIELAGNFGLTN